LAKSIQIRNVPDHLHRKLKKRAARMGMTLSAYLIAVFKRSAEVPTAAELRRRLRRLPPPPTEVGD